MTPKLQAWLSTGRISNLPTVWCNCIVLLFVLLPSRVTFPEAYIDNFSLWFLLASATCIYIGGCFQGDAFDIIFDKKYNPERPIPSGILSHTSVLTAAITLLLAGIAIAYFSTSFTSNASPSEFLTRQFHSNVSTYAGIGLVTIVTLYSWLHKQSAWFSLTFIGGCRFALVLFSSSFLVSLAPGNFTLPWPYIQNHPSVLLVALAVGLYTVSFASVARIEHTKQGVRWATILELGMLALPLPYLIHFYMNAPASQDTPWLSLICLVFYGSWIYKSFRALPKSKGVFVSQCLAGFCLLDACFLSTSGLFPVLLAMLLFVGANVLQRIASAT